jgi:hypothetical protein
MAMLKPQGVLCYLSTYILLGLSENHRLGFGLCYDTVVSIRQELKRQMINSKLFC